MATTQPAAFRSLPLDADIAAMCDMACEWLNTVATFAAQMMGVTLGAAIAACIRPMWTGYMPKTERNVRDHGLYCMGVKVSKRRTPAAEARVAREAAILYGVAS